MPSIPVPGVAQCNVRATLFEQQIENVLNFASSFGPGEPIDLDACATTLLNSWAVNMLPAAAPQYILREVYAIDLTTSTGATFTSALNPPQTGTALGAGLPGDKALVITHRTLLRGRSYRGRTYIAGISREEQVGNFVGAGTANAVINGFQAVIADMADAGFTFVIVSRQLNNVPRTEGVATPVATSLLRDNRLDTQRRRNSGVGA